MLSVIVQDRKYLEGSEITIIYVKNMMYEFSTSNA